MTVQKNVSQYQIIQGRSYLIGILNQSDVANYPLNWTVFDQIKTISELDESLITNSSDSSANISYAHENITYVSPSGSSVLNETQMKQINALNPIWKQVRILVNLFYNSISVIFENMNFILC